MDHRIAVIKGDGVGPEVVDAALGVLDAVAKKYGHKFKSQQLLAGGAAIDEEGVPLPKKTLKEAKKTDAVLLGAVGGPKWDSQPGEKRPEQAILGLREELALFANLRPVSVREALVDASPLKAEIVSGADLLIVRELTGGIYFGSHGTEVIGEANAFGRFVDFLKKEKTLPPGRFAYDVEQYSEVEIRRIGELAFEMAMKRNKRVTSVDKANVLDSSRLWRQVMEEVRVKYPEVRLNHMYVDNMAQQLILDPKQFDVIVTSNLFGDILSDEASQITGSIGMLPSASLGDGTFGLYEPIHGSAPDIAGRDLANPIATILSAALMLRYSFGMLEEAIAVEQAVDGFLLAGNRTPDIYVEGMTKVGTAEAGRLIAERIGSAA